MIEREFVGLYAGQDLREMSREELYDVLVETLQREAHANAEHRRQLRLIQAFPSFGKA